MRKRNWLIVFLLITLFSCKRKQAAEILPINSMKLVMWDILKSDEWYTQTAMRDTLHLRLNENFQIYEQVFKIHHITKAQFYNSYKYYETHPDQFKVLIDSVVMVGDRDKVIEKTEPVPANPK